MKREFLGQLPCVVTYRIAICHSVTFVHITNVTSVVLYDCHFEGVTVFVRKVTHSWWIMHICRHVYFSSVLPNCSLVLTCKSSLFSSSVFQPKSRGISFLLGLTVSQQLLCFIHMFLNKSGEEKKNCP